MTKQPEAPYTRIIRNGWHAPDEPPAPLEELFALLEKHAVAPWTTCRPLRGDPVATLLCGEFASYKHPFSILSNEPAIVRRLTEAYTANCDRVQVEADEPRLRRPRHRNGPRRR